MAAYFDLLRTAAVSAAEPGSEEVTERYDGASKSTTVASHVRHRPFCHETNVRPLGRFPSSLSNPDGSLVAGTSQRLRARQIRSLIRGWRVKTGHGYPRVLSNASQEQVCASQGLSPRHKPIATQIVSSNMHRLQEEMGAQRASHYCGLLWALKVLLCRGHSHNRSKLWSNRSWWQEHCQAEHSSLNNWRLLMEH